MILFCCGAREYDVRSSAAAVDMITDCDAVSGFDIDDTPVTFRTRPTRAKLVSTMLRQRTISQNVATSRILTRTTSALSRDIVTDASDKMALSLARQSSSSTVQSTGQSSADISVPEEVMEHSLSPSLGKFASRRRSRSSITRMDAAESPLSLHSSELALKADALRPVKLETTATVPLSTATSLVKTSAEAVLSRVSPTKPVLTAAVFDSSAELSECKNFEAVTSRISPIARNNQTLLQHLKRPPSFPGAQSDAADMKKLRTSPANDIKYPSMDAMVRSSLQAGESKTSHSFDQLSSSSLSVTFNPPSRQPLSVKLDASNTSNSSSTVVPSSQAVSAKSNVTSPRFVSHFPSVITVIKIIICFHRFKLTLGDVRKGI